MNIQQSPVTASPNEQYILWDKQRKKLWEGGPEIRDGSTEAIIEEAVIGMRKIITDAWSIINDRDVYSHWSILEMLDEHLNIHALIEKLSVIGITRESCPEFDTYCRHLELRPGITGVSKEVTGGVNKVLSTDPEVMYSRMTGGGQSGF